MIHTFKSCGVQATVDSRDGTVRILDSLTYSMIPLLPPMEEMTKELPMGIRYALAKYDSQDLRRAYGELYELYTAEKAEETTDSIGSYVIISEIDEDTMAKIPAGSRVVSYVTCVECADWLKKTYPALNFEFAADEDVSRQLENAVTVFSFENTQELIDKVVGLFKNGVKKIAGYPKNGMADTEACESYEKLCRELVRMKKKGESGVFVPFAFEESPGRLVVVDGKTIAPYDGGTFSSVYMKNGRMPLNAAFLKSNALIDTCAECAVVLTAR